MGYAVWEPATNVVLTNNDLTATPNASGVIINGNGLILDQTGKRYFEVEVTGVGDHSISCAIGIITSVGHSPTSQGWSFYGTTGHKRHSNTSQAYGDAYGVGDIVGIALNTDNGQCFFYRNGTYYGGAYTNCARPFIASIRFVSSDSYNGNVNYVLHSDPANMTGPIPNGYTAGYEAADNAKVIDSMTCAIGINASTRLTENASDSILLLHADSTDGSVVFKDNSVFDRAITVQGNAQHNTGEKKFGDSAAEFYRDSLPGLLSLPNLAERWERLGDNDFTIDFWFYYELGPSTLQRCVTLWGADSGNRAFAVFWLSSGGMRFQWQDNTGEYDYSSFGYPTIDAWNHAAIVKKGTRLMMFLAGNMSVDMIFPAGRTFGLCNLPLQIGGYDENNSGDAGTDTVGGFIDEVNIRTIAAWDSAFDPPSVPYGNPSLSFPEIFAKIGIGNEVTANTDAEQYAAWSDANIGNWSFTFSGPELMRISRVGEADHQRAEVDKTNATSKYYFEWIAYPGTNEANCFVGLTKYSDVYDEYLGYSDKEYSICAFNGKKYHASPGKFGVEYGLPFDGGDIVMCAHDPISGKIWWGKNGTWFDSGDPAAGTGEAYNNATGQLVASISGLQYGQGAKLRSSPHQLTYTPPVGFTPGIRGQDSGVPVYAEVINVIGIGGQTRFVEDAPPVGGNDEFVKFLLHSNENQGSVNFKNSAYNRPNSYPGLPRGTTFHTQSVKVFDRSSVQFNGSDSMVSFNSHTSWSLGTGSFTIDLWLRIHFNQTEDSGIISAGSSTSAGWCIFFEGQEGVGDGQRIVFKGNWGDLFIYCATDYNCIPLDSWVHLALVRDANVTPPVHQFYINGQPSGEAALNSSIPSATQDLGIGCKRYGVWEDDLFRGTLDEIRISVGIARWMTAFTPADGPYTSLQLDTAPFINATIGIKSKMEAWTDVDLPPAESFGNDINTVLLIHSDSVQGDTEFIDSSSNAGPLLRVGDTIHDDGDPKMGATAILFDGYGDQINTAKLSIYEFGFDPFTIDFWIKPKTLEYHAGIITNGDVANGGWVIEFDHGNGHLRFLANLEVVCETIDYISYMEWTHVALVRSNNTATGYQFYVNGYKSGEPGDATQALPVTDNGIMIGRGNSVFWPSFYYDGLLEEIRVSNIARYTEPFTVKEVPYSSPVTEYNPEILAGIGINATVWAGEQPRLPVKMINFTLGIGSTIRLATTSLATSTKIGIGAKMMVSPYIYSQVGVGIGIGSTMSFQSIRVAREVNIGIGIGTKLNMSNPVFLVVKGGIGIGSIFEINVMQTVKINVGVGISNSIVVLNNGDADPVDCELPEFSDKRWC